MVITLPKWDVSSATVTPRMFSHTSKNNVMLKRHPTPATTGQPYHVRHNRGIRNVNRQQQTNKQKKI